MRVMCTVFFVGVLLVGCINGIRSNNHMIRSIIGQPISETVFVAGAYANYNMNDPVLCMLRKLSYKQEGYFFLAKSLCTDYTTGECDIFYYKVDEGGIVVDAWFDYDLARRLKEENKNSSFWCDEEIRKGKNMKWKSWILEKSGSN